MNEGRPTDKTPEVVDKICSLLLEGQSITAMCKQQDDLPESRTVFRWLSEDPEFSHRYARAKIAGCEALADALLEIADDGTNDYVERENKRGQVVTMLDQEHVQRSRLRVDTRKWYLSKIVPKIYGERIQHADTDVEGNAAGRDIDDTTLVARIDALYAAAARRQLEHDLADLV